MDTKDLFNNGRHYQIIQMSEHDFICAIPHNIRPKLCYAIDTEKYWADKFGTSCSSNDSEKSVLAKIIAWQEKRVEIKQKFKI
jgi:hypothetical protein